MSDPNRLEAAIAADPDDGDAWIVYADWLLARGDPWGERLARSLRGEPVDALDRAHREDFHGRALAEWIETGRLARVMALEARHGFTLHAKLTRGVPASTVRPLVDSLLAAPSSRFLRSLTIDDPDVDALVPALAELEVPTWFERLSLSTLGDRGAAAMFESADGFARLPALELPRHGLSDAGVAQLRALFGERVTFGLALTGDGPLDRLLGEPSTVSLREIGRRLDALADGRSPEYATLEARALAWLERWDPDARFLHFDDVEYPWALIATRRRWSHLITGLVFEYRGPLEADFEALAGFTHLSGLRRLEVRRGRLSIAAARRLGDGDLLRRVERLGLSRVGLNPEHAAALARADALAGVRILDVEHSPLGDEGLASLLTKLDAIEDLDIGGTGLRDPVAAGLTRLAPRIRRLNVAGNPLGDAGVIALAQALAPDLERLQLGWSVGMGDAGAIALARAASTRLDARIEVGAYGLGLDALTTWIDSGHPGLRAAAREGLDAIPMAELRLLAKARGLRGISRLRKPELISTLIAGARTQVHGAEV